MWSGALDQELRSGDQCGDVVAHHALIVGVVALVQVADGQVPADDAGAVTGKVVAVTLEGAGTRTRTRGQRWQVMSMSQLHHLTQQFLTS